MLCKLQDITIMQQCHITVIALSVFFFFAIYLTTLLVVCHFLDHFQNRKYDKLESEFEFP